MMDTFLDEAEPELSVASDEQPTGCMFKELPHEGRVILTTQKGRSLLVHKTALSLQELPHKPHGWSLEFVDGYGVCANGDDDDILFLTEFLNRRVFEDQTGSLHVQQKSAGSKCTVWSLSDKMRAYSTRHVYVAAMDHAGRWPVYLLEWPRAGGRVAWGVQRLYGFLGLKSYKGVASKWTCYQMPSWRHVLSDMFEFPDAFMPSTCNLKKEEAQRTTTSFLPALSCTTPGFVALVARLAVAAPQQHGTRDEGARERAKALLLTMVDAAVVKPFALEVQLCRDFKVPWPAPSVPDMTLAVSPDGEIVMQRWDALWESLEEHERSATLVDWTGALTPLRLPNGNVGLKAFLCQSGSADPRTGGLWNQIAFALARRLEARIVESDWIEECDWPIRLVPPEEEDLGQWSSREVDVYCRQHVVASKAATDGCLHLGFAIDKVAGMSLDLQNGCVSNQSGVVCELVPQVTGLINYARGRWEVYG